jgi:hypothetical protein
MEAGALHCAAGDLASVASRVLPLVLEAQVKGGFKTAKAILRDNRIDQGHGDE